MVTEKNFNIEKKKGKIFGKKTRQKKQYRNMQLKKKKKSITIFYRTQRVSEYNFKLTKNIIKQIK